MIVCVNIMIQAFIGMRENEFREGLYKDEMTKFRTKMSDLDLK